MERKELINYYNKFCEEKRLDSRHGQVEFNITMRYILDFLKEFECPKVVDIGAGTGRYSIELASRGFDVTAIELVKYNLGILKSKNSRVKAMQGDAVNLKKIGNETFDVTLLLGPMYHLLKWEEKIKALQEAKRITKKGGIIFVAYCMNDYAVITRGFKQGLIIDAFKCNKIDAKFKLEEDADNLYSYVTLEDIDELNREVGLARECIIAPDGPADYMRQYLNKMDDATFNAFIEYQFINSKRKDLIGASSHTLDILKKDAKS